MVETFTLDDVAKGIEDLSDSDDDGDMGELETWAKKAIEPRHIAPVVFDIETGPRPDDELRSIYHEKTFEEFCDGCDARWKEDTRKAKYEEYKANGWSEFIAKGALSATTGRVLAVGIAVGGKTTIFGDADESKLIGEFWWVVENAIEEKQPIIGHNSHAFDLPFLLRRSWAVGISIPRIIRQGRYWNPLFQDTMEVWGCGTREMIKLDVLGQLFGVGRKTEGIGGGDFHKLWFGTMPAEKWGDPEQQRAKAIEYLGQDLRLTEAVAKRMGLI